MEESFSKAAIQSGDAFLLQAYAMTEASHQMTSNPLPKNGPHKAGTVGRAQGSVKVAILNDQNQKARAPPALRTTPSPVIC